MIVNVIFVMVAIVYFVTVAILWVYGLNFYYLSYLALKSQSSSVLTPVMDKEWPTVTIQVPLYNELNVAERIIEAAATIDYPVERLEIQILDDSTDETVVIARELAEQLREEGFDISHLHRQQRDGYKAGALRDGLECARGEFVAIFDADFVPVPDFLKRTIPYFEDEQLAFVQTRWDHTNWNESLLTYLQSIAIDAHFMVEQLSRSRYGYWFNFNGTAGVWRKSAIEDAGGWQATTLTEDLDLSYRIFLKGWQAAYLPDLSVPSEIPLTFTAYRRQQHRWARGSLENAVRLLPDIWESKFPLMLKLEGTLHLTGYSVHLLLFVLSLLYPIVVLLSVKVPALITMFGIGPLFSVTALAPTILFIAGQKGLKRVWWKMLPAFLFVSASGSGMMVNTLRATIDLMRGSAAHFERTPKYGNQKWQQSQYRLQFDRIVFWELLLGIFNLATCGLAIRYGYWFIALYALIFGVGLLFNAIYTMAQSINEIQTS